MSDPRGLGRRLLLRVRMNAKEKTVFDHAADLSGLTLSSWARMVLREAAAAKLHAAGRKVEL